jgi:enamine deaminase RidA (YjgF/YER057c/UK114 family)
MDRQRISSVSPYEDVIGFSRAVRVGDLVFVSGTVAWGPDGTLVEIEAVAVISKGS